VGVTRAKALYSVVSNDIVNLEIGLSARSFTPGLRLILRIFDQSISREIREHLDMRVVKALHDAGVGLLLGTDPANPFILWGFATHKELAQLVAAGLSPYEAVAAGTRNAAEYLGALDEFGTVEAGKRADLILVDANPLNDVANVQRIAGVMLRGRWLARADLQRELDAVADEIRRYEEYIKAQVK